MKHLLSLFLFSLVFSAVWIPPSFSKSYGNFENVVFHRCYDGDTCTFTLPGIHPLLGEKISILLNGVDTPEIRGKCPKEKRLAKRAKAHVNRLLKQAHTIRLLNVSRGKYFRIVADIEVDGVLLKEVLLRDGLAYRYDGGTKQSWC